MSFPLSDAEIGYQLLLLEATEMSDKFFERLEELYREYPSQGLRETIERLRDIRQNLPSMTLNNSVRSNAQPDQRPALFPRDYCSN